MKLLFSVLTYTVVNVQGYMTEDVSLQKNPPVVNQFDYLLKELPSLRESVLGWEQPFLSQSDSFFQVCKLKITN